MRKLVLLGVLLLTLLVAGLPVSADSVKDSQIVTLGADLTDKQKKEVMADMGVTEDDVTILYVTNEEEHQYLGEYIDASKIGTRSISSSLILLLDEGEGITVETNNISQVSEGMFANALVTAGIQDAYVYVTAPFEVSGTAGLTGLTKAWEEATDTEISEEQKQVANEEMVLTSELSEDIGAEQALELINRIKDALADKDIETEDELRELILSIADDMGITLSDDMLNQLVKLFQNMEKAGINWDDLKKGLSNITDGVTDFVKSDEAKSFFAKAGEAISSFFALVFGWLANLFSGE